MSRPEPLAITGFGLCTSLGGAVQTAAAVRAGLSRPKPLTGITVYDEDLGDNVEPVGYPAAGVTDGFSGLGRLVQLSLAAWADLASSGAGFEPPARSALLLCLPDPFLAAQVAARAAMDQPARAQRELAALQERQRAVGRGLLTVLAKHARLPPGLSLPQAFHEGAGGVRALEEAARLLDSGAADCVLVLAVESLVELANVEALQELMLLHSAETPVGVMPGEAAAFLALERRRGAERRKAPILATVSAPAVLREAYDRCSSNAPYGRALPEAILQAHAAAESPPSSFMGSQNGDEWKAREWGVALTRIPAPLRELPLLLPSESLGELGTAFPYVAAILAVRALQRGYAGGGSVQVWASGDDGVKASFVVGPSPRSISGSPARR